KGFLAKDDMPLGGNLGVNFQATLFVIFPDKPPYNKIEIVFHLSAFHQHLSFAKPAHPYHRKQGFGKLLIRNIYKLADILQKWSGAIHITISKHKLGNI